MPSVWLPDMEPEASNTIMASSVQGEGFFSSPRGGRNVAGEKHSRGDGCVSNATRSGKRDAARR